MESTRNDGWQGVYTPKLWTPARHRGMDRRTRTYKFWARVRAQLVQELGHEPSRTEAVLIDTLCDRLLDAETMRAERHAGIRHSENDARGAAAEIRRLLRELGLLGKSNGVGGDEQPKRLADVLGDAP